jgi:predicted CoA-binding protein
MLLDAYTDPFSFLKKEYKYAVVEASNDSMKLGFRVYADLKKANFEVYPVNRAYTQIHGDPCFPDLNQLRPYPDVVVIATTYAEDEDRGLWTLQDMVNNGIFRAWVEPGCETEDMQKYARDNNVEIVTGFSLSKEITPFIDS